MKDENSSHWHVIKVTGLKTKDHNLQKLSFLDEKNGFFLGSEFEFEDVKNNRVPSGQNAIISKSTDGGEHWKTDIFGKGMFFHFQKTSQNTICAMKEVYSGLGSGKFEYIEAFNSTDGGEHWTSKFKTKIEFIAIMFLDSSVGIGVSRTEGIMNNKIFSTKDGGQNWNELKDIKGYYCNESIEIKDSKFYLLGSNQNNSNDYNLLFEIDINKDKINIEQIKIGPVDHIYIDSFGKFWLIKDGDKKIEVYIKSGDFFEPFKKIESNNEIFLDQIYSYKDNINLILSETIGQGVKHTFLRTENSGAIWTEEKLPLNLMVKPSSFYKENYVWIYSGGDRLQVRK